MINNKNLEQVEVANDILELTHFIKTNDPKGYFDKNKGIELIEKHKRADEFVATVNSPIIPGFVLYENATNEMICNMILGIRDYLVAKQTYKEVK